MDDQCIWKEDQDGAWDTECGNRFDIINGTPIENQMNFCPFCGKGLQEERNVTT